MTIEIKLTELNHRDINSLVIMGKAHQLRKKAYAYSPMENARLMYSIRKDHK